MPPTPTPTTTMPTSTSTATTTTTTTSSTPTRPASPPPTGVLRYLDGNHYIGEVPGELNGNNIEVVDAPQVWSLDASGHLISPGDNVLVTDGTNVLDVPNTETLPTQVAPYVCTINAASSPTQTILDCSATLESSVENDFVLCYDEVETTAYSCDDESAITFRQFTLNG